MMRGQEETPLHYLLQGLRGIGMVTVVSGVFMALGYVAAVLTAWAF